MANNLETEEGTIVYSEAPATSGNDDIDALIRFGQKWGGAVGDGVEITFSIATSSSFWSPDYDGVGETSARGYLNTSQANAFRDALQAWSDVADITFDEITDSSNASGEVGVIRAAFQTNLGSGGESGHAWLPGFFESSGDVWLNQNVSGGWGASEVAPGGDGFATMLHEIGHALGLDHPGNDLGTHPDFDVSMTLMSYNTAPKSLFRDVINNGGGSFSFEWYYIQPETPMPLDILAIQYLYGENMSHNVGNTTYTFSTTRPFFKTIWDGGGTDTISVSNFNRGCTIDLGAGNYSSIRIPSDAVPAGFSVSDPEPVYDGTNNLAIAFGVTIERAIGGNGPDKLFGNNAANVLTGNGGNDTLKGLGGTDTLAGGAGNDVYVINAATEINKAAADAGTDTVQSSVTYVLGAQQENLSLIAAGALNGTGNTAANTLKGGAGNNVLKGSGGNDTLAGGAGNDSLTGGAGQDIFQFSAAPGATNVDTIADFNATADAIHLADSKFTAIAYAGGLDALDAAEFAANGSGTAGDASDRIIYNTSNGQLFYDPDGSGASAAIRIATLTGAPALTVNDIFIYDG